MKTERITLIASMVALCFLTLASATTASAQTQGMIISRNGDTFVMNGSSGRTTVVLTDATDTRDNRGLFGLEKEHLGDAVLIPGLKVKVEGSHDNQGRIVASKITVDGDDLETAEMIQSGLHPTAEQVAANMRAIEQNQNGVAVNKAGVAVNKQNIAMNQQNIAANKQQIESNIKATEQNTARFTALADYDVKGQATVKFDVGSSKISAR